MFCDFEDNPTPGQLAELVCSRCGIKVTTLARKRVRLCGGKAGHKPQQTRGLCSLLGEQVALFDCKSCGGNVKIKVFACPLHELCVIGKKIDGVQNCAACDDWR